MLWTLQHVSSLAELEARVAELRAQIKQRPENIGVLRRELHDVVRRLSALQHPEARRAAYRRYHQRVYLGQQTAAPLPRGNVVTGVAEPSALRVPEARSGRCPKCGAALVARDNDGPYCIYDGWHSFEAPRPWCMELAPEPMQQVGRWG